MFVLSLSASCSYLNTCALVSSVYAPLHEGSDHGGTLRYHHCMWVWSGVPHPAQSSGHWARQTWVIAMPTELPDGGGTLRNHRTAFWEWESAVLRGFLGNRRVELKGDRFEVLDTSNLDTWNIQMLLDVSEELRMGV